MDPAQPYSIRPCRDGDLSRIVEIEKAAFPDPYDRSIFTQLLRAEPGGFLVAEGGGKVLGYVTAVSRGGDATIYSIAVSNDRRRSGIGRGLMNAELSYLSRKAESVYLQVSVNNPAAIALYKEFSFVELGRIRRYYPNGDDALVMRRILHASPPSTRR